MDPITDYQIGKSRHQEIEEKYFRYRVSNANEPGQPGKYRLLVGLGSLMLGILVLIQRFIG